MSTDNLIDSNRRSRLLVILLLMVTVLVLIAGVILVARFIQEARNGGPAHISYLKEIDDAKRAGIPVTPQMLQAPLPPVDQNAAPIYTQLTQLIANHPLTSDDKIVDLTSSK